MRTKRLATGLCRTYPDGPYPQELGLTDQPPARTLILRLGFYASGFLGK